MDSLDAGFAGGAGMDRFGKHLRQDFVAMIGQDGIQVGDQHLADKLSLAQHAILRGNEDKFSGFQRVGNGHCYAVRIDAVGFAIPIEAQRWNHRV